ncbi:MAG: TIGR04282 family arsenosugar biosynthesis glycosyltransferase [Acidimicrobiales bacterium]
MVTGHRASHVLVMAKAPVAGRVKTRLCPPLDPVEAAQLAEAALADTLEAVAACGAGRRILALDGEPGEWLPPGFTLIPQRGDGLAERLSNAWAEAGGPGLQLGMDTPQVSATLLEASLGQLMETGTDAVLGPAQDGGWWAIGFRQPDPGAFAGVPMSSPFTGQAQRARLEDLGLRFSELPQLTDVDRIDDALAVAAAAPASRFAAILAELGLRTR